MAQSDPDTRWETVAAKQAEEWLNKTNLDNRSISTDRVIRYGEDIEAGRWLQTHQGIAFDKNGVLLDGQQRLAAIVLTGVPIRVLVTRGLDPEVRGVIDQGKSRSIEDAMKLDGGVKVPRIAIQIARSVMLAPRFETRITWSPAMIREVADRNLDLLNAAASLCERNAKIRSKSAILALCARALQTRQKDLIARFVNVLISGETNGGAEEKQIIRLRDWMRESPEALRAGTAGTAAVYQRAQVVLESFLNGECPLKLVKSTTEDLFPLEPKRYPSWFEETKRKFGMRHKMETAEELKEFDSQKRRDANGVE